MSKKDTSKRLLARRDKTIAAIGALAAKAAEENRELNAAEISERDKLAKTAGKLEGRAVSARVDERAAKRDKAAEKRNGLGIGNTKTTTGIRVGAGERTYRRGGAYSYMWDLTASAMGNTGAQERLRRHAAEVVVDVSEAEARMAAGSAKPWDAYHIRQARTAMAAAGASQFEAQYRDLSTAAGSGGEFVPPLYLTEQYVPYARPGRVFADACHKEDLPPGTMSLNIPKVSGGTTVDTQGAQNTAVSDTDLATEYVTFPVVTIAGQQTLSLQLLERSPIAFDDVTFRDLHLAMAQKVDAKCIAGPGAGDITGLLNTTGIIDVPWNTGGTGGITGFYGVVAQAKGAIASARFLPATHAFLTPDRWEWLEQQLDANKRPLIVPEANGPWNATQVAPDSAVAEGVTGGRLLGLTTLQDFNVPANLGVGVDQDAIIVAKMDDLYLYESPIVARALPQTYGAQLSVLLQVYEYAAFTAARYPVAGAFITGTELTNPVVFNS